MDMIYWDHYYNTILVVNLLIAIGLFACMRFFIGAISHVDSSVELFRKDNPAFGISLAGATFGVTIMLSGTLYGSPDMDMQDAIISVGLFGALGIVLMGVTRLIFGKITLPAISLRNEIVGGNMAVAFADAANVIASAIIIRAVMVWVTASTFEGMLLLLGGYAVSQILLTGMTLLRLKTFGGLKDKSAFQEELKKGNIALALRFAGEKIGIAFAITMASQIVVFEEDNIIQILSAWFIASLIIVAVWKALCFIAEKIILFKVDVNDEVIAQRNMAVGALQAVIYISLGLLLSTL